MTIIERTPIVLPNDNADTVEAVIYTTGQIDCPYQVYILAPTLNRIIEEFDDESIIALWADQYPEWAKKIAPVIWRGHKAETVLMDRNNLNPKAMNNQTTSTNQIVTKTFVFKVRGLKQEIELPWMLEKAARLRALAIFRQRGFVDLKLSEVKISKW